MGQLSCLSLPRTVMESSPSALRWPFSLHENGGRKSWKLTCWLMSPPTTYNGIAVTGPKPQGSELWERRVYNNAGKFPVGVTTFLRSVPLHLHGHGVRNKPTLSLRGTTRQSRLPLCMATDGRCIVVVVSSSLSGPRTPSLRFT